MIVYCHCENEWKDSALKKTSKQRPYNQSHVNNKHYWVFLYMKLTEQKQVVCTEASQRGGLRFEPDRWFGSFHALSTCGCSDFFTLSKDMDVRQWGSKLAVNMAVNVDVNGHLSVCFSPGCASPHLTWVQPTQIVR